jgi:hypothetical protein
MYDELVSTVFEFVFLAVIDAGLVEFAKTMLDMELITAAYADNYMLVVAARNGDSATIRMLTNRKYNPARVNRLAITEAKRYGHKLVANLLRNLARREAFKLKI